MCWCLRPCGMTLRLSRMRLVEHEPTSYVWRCLREWRELNRSSASVIERISKKTGVGNRLPRPNGNHTSNCNGNTAISICFTKRWNRNVSNRSCSIRFRVPIIGGGARHGWWFWRCCRANRRCWCCRPCVRSRIWPRPCRLLACAFSHRRNPPMERMTAISPF